MLGGSDGPSKRLYSTASRLFTAYTALSPAEGTRATAAS